MKNSAIKYIVVAAAVLTLTFVLAEPVAAQCAMCKASAETNLKAGGGDPRGLNMGILYMFALPYLLVFGIGFWWWSNMKKERQQEEAHDISKNDLARYN